MPLRMTGAFIAGLVCSLGSEFLMKEWLYPVFLGLMHARSPCPQIRMLQKGDPINVGFSSLQSSEIN